MSLPLMLLCHIFFICVPLSTIAAPTLPLNRINETVTATTIANNKNNRQHVVVDSDNTLIMTANEFESDEQLISGIIEPTSVEDNFDGIFSSPNDTYKHNENSGRGVGVANSNGGTINVSHNGNIQQRKNDNEYNSSLRTTMPSIYMTTAIIGVKDEHKESNDNDDNVKVTPTKARVEATESSHYQFTTKPFVNVDAVSKDYIRNRNSNHDEKIKHEQHESHFIKSTDETFFSSPNIGENLPSTQESDIEEKNIDSIDGTVLPHLQIDDDVGGSTVMSNILSTEKPLSFSAITTTVSLINRQNTMSDTTTAKTTVIQPYTQDPSSRTIIPGDKSEYVKVGKTLDDGKTVAKVKLNNNNHNANNVKKYINDKKKNNLAKTTAGTDFTGDDVKAYSKKTQTLYDKSHQITSSSDENVTIANNTQIETVTDIITTISSNDDADGTNRSSIAVDNNKTELKLFFEPFNLPGSPTVRSHAIIPLTTTISPQTTENNNIVITTTMGPSSSTITGEPDTNNNATHHSHHTSFSIKTTDTITTAYTIANADEIVSTPLKKQKTDDMHKEKMFTTEYYNSNESELSSNINILYTTTIATPIVSALPAMVHTVGDNFNITDNSNETIHDEKTNSRSKLDKTVVHRLTDELVTENNDKNNNSDVTNSISTTNVYDDNFTRTMTSASTSIEENLDEDFFDIITDDNDPIVSTVNVSKILEPSDSEEFFVPEDIKERETSTTNAIHTTTTTTTVAPPPAIGSSPIPVTTTGDPGDDRQNQNPSTIQHDADTIFYISNTEVKVIESSAPTPNANQENQFFPAIYEEDVIIDFSSKNYSNWGNVPDKYEEDIILSPLKANFDPTKLNGDSVSGGGDDEDDDDLSISYIGESFIDVKESKIGAGTVNTIDHNIIVSDVIIQPVEMLPPMEQPQISIGVPIIAELPPQIELKPIAYNYDYTKSKSVSSDKNYNRMANNNNNNSEHRSVTSEIMFNFGDNLQKNPLSADFREKSETKTKTIASKRNGNTSPMASASGAVASGPNTTAAETLANATAYSVLDDEPETSEYTLLGNYIYYDTY